MPKGKNQGSPQSGMYIDKMVFSLHIYNESGLVKKKMGNILIYLNLNKKIIIYNITYPYFKVDPFHTKSEEFTRFQQYASIIMGNHVFVHISKDT
jgi:hypothetical protein